MRPPSRRSELEASPPIDDQLALQRLALPPFPSFPRLSVPYSPSGRCHSLLTVALSKATYTPAVGRLITPAEEDKAERETSSPIALIRSAQSHSQDDLRLSE
jgi:hypothetical protein